MPRPKKTLHPFDAYLGSAIRATRARRGITREQLAAESGIALSNLKRRESGTNETTVSELERIAKVLAVTSREIVDMALTDYNGGGTPDDGLRKLIASMSAESPTVDPLDEVSYEGHVQPEYDLAADEGERVQPKD